MFSDCHTLHFGLSFVKEECPPIKAHVESADLRPWPKLESELWNLIDFISDIVAAFHDEKHFVAFLKFLHDYVARIEKSNFQKSHKLAHKTLEEDAVPREEWVLLESVPAWRRLENSFASRPIESFRHQTGFGVTSMMLLVRTLVHQTARVFRM